MKKLSYIIPVVLLLSGCGDGGTETDESVGGSIDSANTSDGTTDDLDMADVDKNSIEHYVEKYLDADVVDEAEAMNPEEGLNYFFEILDNSRGYARVSGMMEGSMEFCLWRMENGNDLVGYSASSCGPVCDYTFNLMEYTNDDRSESSTESFLPWEEIEAHKDKLTEDINNAFDLDYPEDVQLHFRPPLVGTSMDVEISAGANELEFLMMTLSWDKKKFSVEEKYELPKE